uniref:Uncharacterized protein n=1 Tax=Palpitomonas bilix TaxID=652834 RepID=A0A7S3DIJ2_9EUKA|mmetsp:Transcript_39529/g.101478  ORF Transcript_39529/g.101478 Transcript_39529/m.101478 type:complete len:687 (+) Transcript_39529:315-2375(+)
MDLLDDYVSRDQDQRTSKNHPLIVLGEHGSGKTILVGQWVQRFGRTVSQKSSAFSSPNTLLYAASLIFPPEMSSYRKLVLDIYDFVSVRLHFRYKLPSQVRNENIRSFFEGLLMAIDRLLAGTNMTLTIVVDGFNGLEQEIGVKGESSITGISMLFPLELPSSINLILVGDVNENVAAIPEHVPVVAISPFMSLSSVRKTLAPLIPRPDVRASFWARMEEISKVAYRSQVQDMGQTPTDASIHPRSFFLLCELVNGRPHDGRLGSNMEPFLRCAFTSLQDQSTLDALLGEVIRSWEIRTSFLSKGGSSVIWDALAFLYVARRGLSSSELVGCLGIDRNIERFELIHTLHSSTLIALCDGQMAIGDQYFRCFVGNRIEHSLHGGITEYHARLATYMSSRKWHRRVAEELPHHLMACNENDLLQSLLERPEVFITFWTGWAGWAEGMNQIADCLSRPQFAAMPTLESPRDSLPIDIIYRMQGDLFMFWEYLGHDLVEVYHSLYATKSGSWTPLARYLYSKCLVEASFETSNSSVEIAMLKETLLLLPNLHGCRVPLKGSLKDFAIMDPLALRLRLASLLYQSGALSQSLDTIKAVESDAEQLSSRTVLACSLFIRGKVEWGQGDLSSSKCSLENASEAFRRIEGECSTLRAEALRSLGMVLLALNCDSEGSTVLQQAAAIVGQQTRKV